LRLAARMMLSDKQWKQISGLFPAPKTRRDRRGRPWACNRRCLEGILWVLRTGARWRDVPALYPNGSTCWRRLRMWEEKGVWLRAWQALLARMDERRLLDWEEAFLDATFVLAKKGAPRSEKHVAATAYLSERNSRPRRFPSFGSPKAR